MAAHWAPLYLGFSRQEYWRGSPFPSPNGMLFLETTYWCQGNPDSLSLCFGSSSESWRQGGNEGRTLHPEALSIYRYVQSSWQKGRVFQVGFDREVSCSNSITLKPCVLRQVICSPHLNSRSVLNEFFENLAIKKLNSLFSFHGKVCSFSTRVYSWTELTFMRRFLYLFPWAPGTKAHTILTNSPSLSLCPLLPMILLSIFEICPGSWSNILKNFDIFSHRYQDRQRGSQYTNRIGWNNQ